MDFGECYFIWDSFFVELRSYYLPCLFISYKKVYLLILAGKTLIKST